MVTYGQQVQAVLVQVLHHGGQVPRLPLGEGVLVVGQGLHLWPDFVVGGPEGPRERERERERERDRIKRMRLIFLD